MKKLTIEQVRKRFEEAGLELLEEEYINNKFKMKFKCSEGHIGRMKLNSIMNGHQCLECSGSKKKTIEELREHFSKEGFTLTSKVYVNNKSRLNFICPKGHKGKSSWDDFRSGVRCKECYNTVDKYLSHEEVKRRFNERGYTLLDSDYVDSKTPMNYVCSKGHHNKITVNSLDQGRGCKPCGFSSHKGRYTEVYFHNNPETKDSYGEFYSFEFSIKGQKYLMVGITKNWRDRRRNYKKLDPKDVRVTPMKLYDAFKLEQQFLKENDHLRPTESLRFNGWTECIRIEG